MTDEEIGHLRTAHARAIETEGTLRQEVLAARLKFAMLVVDDVRVGNKHGSWQADVALTDLAEAEATWRRAVLGSETIAKAINGSLDR